MLKTTLRTMLKKSRRASDDAAAPATPLIDIVFQLLVFFLLAVKFVGVEEELSAHLPRNRGPGTGEPVGTLNFFLHWTEDSSSRGRVSCLVSGYLPPDGGPAHREHEFPMLEPSGGAVPYGPARLQVDYAVPSFAEIERYVRDCRTDQESAGIPEGLPVTVRFDRKVPLQMVVTVLDICERQGIRDFAIAQEEDSPDYTLDAVRDSSSGLDATEMKRK